MTMLSINHGAKGIIMWTFPTTPDLLNVTSAFAEVLTNQCADLILGAELSSNLTIDGAPSVDVSTWTNRDRMLLAIVNPSYDAAQGPLQLNLLAAFKPTSLVSLWGNRQWDAVPDRSGRVRSLKRPRLPGLSVDILMLTSDGTTVAATTEQIS